MSEEHAKRSVWAYIGPGLCMAGAAIGVSHIMQSTRAGANFGFALVGLVILANVLKYPAFRFGHWFTAVSGKSLIEGYQALGRWQLMAFQVVCVVTGIGSIGVVSYVTGALGWSMFGRFGTIEGWSFGIMGFCVAVLLAGHYHLLNGLMKWVMVMLAVATFVALGVAVGHGPVAPADFTGPSPWRIEHFAFIIALLGWMPAPIEVSVFQSLWVQAKQRDDQVVMTRREAMIDFNLGYGMTLLLAVCFLALGALVMYGSGETFASSNVAFTGQLQQLYTTHLGAWAGPVIAFAAFAAMFSTTITVIDGYTRALSEGMRTLFPRISVSQRRSHGIWIVLGTIAGAGLILLFQNHPNSLTLLVDIVTVIAFLTAPFFAGLNHWVVFGKQLSGDQRPNRWNWALSVTGLVFLTAFSVLYVLSFGFSR